MGDPLTEEEPVQTGQTSYGDIFDELLPHYIAMGMPPGEYWDGESSLKRAYRKAYQIRLENERRIADANNWYMGQYVAAALRSVALIVPGVNAKPHVEMPDYPDKPFMQAAEEQKKEEIRKQKEEDQQKLAMAMFQQFTLMFNANVEKRLEKEAQAGKTGQ